MQKSCFVNYVVCMICMVFLCHVQSDAVVIPSISAHVSVTLTVCIRTAEYTSQNFFHSLVAPFLTANILAKFLTGSARLQPVVPNVFYIFSVDCRCDVILLVQVLAHQ